MTILDRILPDRSLLPAQLPSEDIAFLDTLAPRDHAQAKAPVLPTKAKPDFAPSALDRMFAFLGVTRA